MEWNKENTALLIEHFKEKRELWDSTSEHFKDRNRKHEAWMYLACKFDTEKSVVEKKMRSLIGQFQREISSKWFGFELLLFLKHKNKVRSTNEAGVSEDNPQDNPQENRTSPKKKKKKTFGSLNAQKEAFDSLQAQKEAYGIMKELQTERKTRDNFSVFGEYIACRLRNLQDPLTISTVQNQIHNIIFQAEMNLYSGGAENWFIQRQRQYNWFKQRQRKYKFQQRLLYKFFSKQ
ncbi:hypothetical protein EVAR_52568_1 [Eumeta japonica]|uniref:MADF domain-containing protein n=1 Tax=Eumeta variegata TaxID=151549 RepID=A0A4C1Y9W8_EUMVA|nr:hypothetical protein EVAR_52568_1 [Eumeta japonica]